MTTDSPWTTIVPGDQSTLPTEADDRIIWRWAGGQLLLSDCNPNFQEPGPVAWMRMSDLPPYTPPEPVKPKRRYWWIVGTTAFPTIEAAELYRSEARACGTQVMPEPTLAIECLPTGDLDPDEAIELKAKWERLKDVAVTIDTLIAWALTVGIDVKDER